jgi:hypothetical protein
MERTRETLHFFRQMKFRTVKYHGHTYNFYLNNYFL